MRKSWQYLAMATVVCGVAISTVQAFQSDCNDSRITRSFRDEKLGDVLAWMSLGKYSFVCADQYYQDRKVSLTLRGATIDEAMEAIAAQTNGKWVQNDSIFTLYPDTVQGFIVPTPPTNNGIGAVFQPFMPESDMGQSSDAHFIFSTKQGVESSGFSVRVDPQALGSGKFEMLAPIDAKFDGREIMFRLPALREIAGSDFSWSHQEPKPFEFDFLSTSPIPEYKLLGDRMQDSDLQKQLKSALEQLEKTISEISKNRDSKMSPEQSANLQKKLTEIQAQLRQIMSQRGNFKFDSDAFRMKMDSADVKRMMELHTKGLDKMKFDFPHGQGFKMSPDQKKEVEKAMQEAEKARGEAFKKLAETKMKLDSDVMKKRMEEVMKLQDIKLDPMHKLEMEKALKQAEKARGEAFKLHETMKEKMGSEEMKKAMEKMKDTKVSWNGKDPIEFEKLLKSLTPKQKELMKSRGHLTPEDLTPQQRELLGKLPDGKYTLSFSKDGQTFTIKGGK
ncbi:MAG: hypothetical protein KF784_10585 [Fimbriimonadaceae bacterium]|nr:hypothetical protein [Fimbriimonadaceae bacterium]